MSGMKMFLLIMFFQCGSEMGLNHLYTDLTRTLIRNYSYKDDSVYIVKGTVATDSHQYKSQPAQTTYGWLPV